MNVKWYNKRSLDHTEMMATLLSKRDAPVGILADLPMNGLIAFNAIKTPIGAAFIRLVEGNIGIFDGYISNPDVNSLIRHVALDKISDKLINFVKNDLRLTYVFGFSSSKAMYERAIAHGFKCESNLKFLSLSLNGGIGLWHS